MPNRTDVREKKPSQTLSTALLDAAAEQCRQVLLAWQKGEADDEKYSPELDVVLYTTLASLIRVSVLRAIQARLRGGSVDKAYRERAFAAHLCQLVIEALFTPSPPWTAASQALILSVESLEYRTPTLPRFIDVSDQLTDPRVPLSHNPLSLIEVYAAVGEVAEELGRAAPLPTFAHDCYAQASQYWQAALSLAHSLHVTGELDRGSLAHLYQRWMALLEERASASQALSEETARVLQRVLQQAFWQLQGLGSASPYESRQPQDDEAAS